MKLKTFTSSSRPDTIAQVSINKTGTFRFNSAAVQKLNLKPDTRIAIHQDEENPQDWYIEFNVKDGFLLREYKDEGLTLTCSATSAQKELFKALSQSKTFSCLLSLEPIEEKYHAIITSSLKVSARA